LTSIFPKAAPVRQDVRLSWEDDPRKADPVGWIQERLGEFIWSKQRTVCKSVRDHRYTAVPSAHGTGKSYIASRIVSWWLDVHPVGEAFVVTTAPTSPQVRAILWREINRAHRKGNLDGYITQGEVPEWKMGGELVGWGRKPADYVDSAQAATAFQGIHARYVLVVLDEAGGIPEWLWDAVDTLVTNDDARVLAIGNPDDPASHFEEVCRPGSGWNVEQISAFDLPAFTGEKVPEELHQRLTGRKWVEERAKRWGVGAPIYISKVLGQFPEVGEDTLISPKMIRDAIARNLPGIETGRYAGDVARLGKDKSVVYMNRGGKIRKVLELHKTTTMETAGKFKKIIESRAISVPMWIDTNGLGAGVYDRMKEQELPVHPFNGSEKSSDPNKYKNKRAEAYWTMKELMEDGLIDLDELDDDLQAQLGVIKWKNDSTGRIQIESKEDIIKRLKVSPDYADAAVMSVLEIGMENLDEFLELLKRNKTGSITKGLLEAQT
jgi:hypothetical protein